MNSNCALFDWGSNLFVLFPTLKVKLGAHCEFDDNDGEPREFLHWGHAHSLLAHDILSTETTAKIERQPIIFIYLYTA